MATLGTLFGGVALYPAGKKQGPANTPPMNAGSKDEEAFIQYVDQHFLYRFPSLGTSVAISHSL